MKIDLYMHGCKESSYDAGKAAGLSEEACETFMYAGYEEKMTYEVNAKTGEAKLIAVNDQPLGAKR